MKPCIKQNQKKLPSHKVLRLFLLFLVSRSVSSVFVGHLHMLALQKIQNLKLMERLPTTYLVFSPESLEGFPSKTAFLRIGLGH